MVHVRRRRRIVEKAIRWGLKWMVKRVVVGFLRKSIGGVMRSRKSGVRIGEGRLIEGVNE